MRDFVYFDLETQRTANDVGGWGNKDRMGMSIGVTYSTKLNEYRIFTEAEVEDLIQQLIAADLVIGFNHVGFDYPVLMGYTILDLPSQVQSLDLMTDIEKKLGHRLKLEAVASASLGFGKTADGLDAIRWWREGKLEEIARYCCYDVKVTRLVYEYGVEHGKVLYHDRANRPQEVEVDWVSP